MPPSNKSPPHSIGPHLLLIHYLHCECHNSIISILKGGLELGEVEGADVIGVKAAREEEVRGELESPFVKLHLQKKKNKSS